MNLTDLVNNLTAKSSSGANKNFGNDQSTSPYLNNLDYRVVISQNQDTLGAAPKVFIGAVTGKLALEQQANFSSPFSSGLLGNGTAGNLYAFTTGRRLVAQVASMQIWQGPSEHFSFTVTANLSTWSNPERDLIQPIKTLLSMVTPSISSSGFLQSPGPNLNAEGVERLGGAISKAGSVVGGSIFGLNDATNLLKDGNQNYVGSIIEKGDRISDELGRSGLTRKALIENNLNNVINISIGRWFSLNNIIIKTVSFDLNTQVINRDSGKPLTAEVTIGIESVFSITTEDIDKMFIGLS